MPVFSFENPFQGKSPGFGYRFNATLYRKLTKMYLTVNNYNKGKIELQEKKLV